MSRCLTPTALAAVLALGCSGEDPWKANRPATVHAEGVVTVDGKPIEGVAVVFAPVDGGHAASAATDADGRFVLQAFPPDDGAVPGSYKVGISKTVEILADGTAVAANPDAAHTLEGATQSSNVVGWRNALPKKYANPNDSGFTADVPQDGTSDLRFEIKGGGA